MGYYQGDYYTGDSMRARFRGRLYLGDPGLFSFLKKAVKGVGRFVGGVIKGPLGGMVAGLIPGGQLLHGAITGGFRGVAREAVATAQPFLGPVWGGLAEEAIGRPHVAGGTPGAVASVSQGMQVARRRTRRLYARRRRRRR